MELKEIKLKSEAELQHLLQEMRKKLDELVFKDNQKQLKDVREIRETRRTIARILTILKEKIKGN